MGTLTKRRFMVLFSGVVGALPVVAFGKWRDVLIDGGYRGTAAMIMESIAKLGLDIAAVNVLLNSRTHSDHASRTATVAS